MGSIIIYLISEISDFPGFEPCCSFITGLFFLSPVIKKTAQPWHQLFILFWILAEAATSVPARGRNGSHKSIRILINLCENIDFQSKRGPDEDWIKAAFLPPSAPLVPPVAGCFFYHRFVFLSPVIKKHPASRLNYLFYSLSRFEPSSGQLFFFITGLSLSPVMEKQDRIYNI